MSLPSLWLSKGRGLAFIDIRIDDRNAEVFLKWLASLPGETTEDMPHEAECFLWDLDTALVR